MARQYQKDLLNELNRLLLMRNSKKTNVKEMLDAHENKYNLVQHIGVQNPGKSDLLTEAHFDNEVRTIHYFIQYYILVKIYWMKAHIVELRGDYTGSINVLNEIMKGKYHMFYAYSN